MPSTVEIVEVGPRDGLQNESVLLETAVKIEFIDRLVAAGAKRLEVASFVHPKMVPAMADSDQLMRGLRRSAGVKYIGLALNERGMRRALDAGCDEVNFVMVASSGFGLRNQNATPEQTAELFERISVLAHDDKVPVSVTISVAFGDPFDGEVSTEILEMLVRRAIAAGASEIALGDTIGVADPWSVAQVIKRISPILGNVPLRMHFHNTRNTALANIYASLMEGVGIVDASCGGIGGCPFAPDATGNVPTEDVLYMLSRAGMATGLDLESMIDTSNWLAKQLGKELPALLPKAGNFPPADLPSA
ncbi:MAG: hydroxymethylglutaryl-CoA lyase [Robiginitomaculum sp.]|nr:MAG: hydroxymethylglutaryl-CoA lyase [Robiginitomaculum sp.]